MHKKIVTFIRLIFHSLRLVKALGLLPAFQIVWMQFFKTVEYKHKYILSYLERHYSKVINNKKYVEQNLNSIPADCVWVCWFHVLVTSIFTKLSCNYI